MTTNKRLGDLVYPLSDEVLANLRPAIIEAIKTVYDPEIPINIYDLGLIYEVQVTSDGIVSIQMTLTSAGCPFAQTLPGLVEKAVSNVEGIVETHVDLVWDPPWTMSDAVRLQFGLI